MDEETLIKTEDTNTPPKVLFMSEMIEKRIMGTKITVSTLVGIHFFHILHSYMIRGLS
jgi:hypothetical protein